MLAALPEAGRLTRRSSSPMLRVGAHNNMKLRRLDGSSAWNGKTAA
ncbi:MAG: hypothetical protein ACLUFI_10755 [Oscillospiraceae bacterium]